jgi:threonine/homoserine/homoserine lactone efflux protein
VLTTFLAGAGAGLAVAVPVGAIGVLIIEAGLRRGFRIAAAAGAGAATVDGIYATVAALFGGAVAALIVPIQTPLRVLSVVILVAIALRLLLSARRTGDGATHADDAPFALRTYLTFFGLTAINPMTVIYFVALIIGLPERPEGLGQQVAFAAGAFGASIGWQVLLAAIAAVGHRRLPASFRAWTTILGALIILVFAAVIGVEALQG